VPQGAEAAHQGRVPAVQRPAAAGHPEEEVEEGLAGQLARGLRVVWRVRQDRRRARGHHAAEGAGHEA
jgi:hypothetical protein